MPAETTHPGPAHRPLETPDGIRPEAFDAFAEMLVCSGKTIFRMPSSCEMYLRQHLADFPDERLLLTEALHRGIPEQILARARSEDYREYLVSAAAGLAKSATMPPASAKWVVEAWAAALNRPPGYRPPTPVGRVVDAPKTPPPISEMNLRLIMGAICGLGGALGGGLGNGGGLLILYLTSAVVDAEFGERTMGLEDVAIVIIISILMLIGGVASGLAAFAGWMFGRGNDKPWAGFGASFGAAFGTACIVFFFFGPGIATACVSAFAAFGAAFTTATRGGHRV